MITYGEAFENSSACNFLLSWRSFIYAPPHSKPSEIYRLAPAAMMCTSAGGCNHWLWSFTSYWRTSVFPLLSILLLNFADIAWWAAGFFTTRPLSPWIPLSTVGSSTAQEPTYAHSSSAFESSFFACDGAHRESQSSVNCSKNAALILEGYCKVVSENAMPNQRVQVEVI